MAILMDRQFIRFVVSLVSGLPILNSGDDVESFFVVE